VLQLTGLDTYVPILAGLEAALETLRAGAAELTPNNGSPP
jgi:hypothetical protein